MSRSVAIIAPRAIELEVRAGTGPIHNEGDRVTLGAGLGISFVKRDR